ncbi:hypothetical protein [Alistipes onderdonkii]|uniref:hypothetical protein n=1 Tax=Alistipes onderdonkii TaxID=328813 RepID=UPI00050A1655|nr:hypothetical protein [Alistipes onderdonkii]
MSQVNKYADKAGYTADKNRKDTQSAVSYVEDDGEVIYDGVNVVVDRDAADAGDLAVFDKTDGTLKFVKGATLLYDRLPPELVPMAVAYGRRGERVRIVALQHLDFYRWAVAYEVKLSGFDLSSGGSFTLHIYTSDLEFTYPAGATLASIAAQINANTKIVEYSWKATASDELNAIVMECNAWSTTEGHKKISASGCTLTKHAEDVDYQTTTAIIPQNTTVNIRRRNGADSHLAGCDNDVFLEYYRENGTTETDILPGSSTIIRESVFTEADNPALVAAYPTYRDYLFGEHLAQYPSAYGAFLQDGKSNTAILAGKTRTDFYGKTVPCYPAAAAAAGYGMQVAGMTTGLETGAWWLPSAEELWLMAKGLIFAQPYDPVNRTLSVSGKVIAKTDYMASSTEYSSLYYFQVNQYGNTRWMLQQQGKSISSIVRPVSEL